MKCAATILLSGLALVSAAKAQPAPKTDPKIETVIVTAPKYHFGVTPNTIAHDFVNSFAAPTVLRDAIARWEVPICPAFAGIAQQYAAVMDARFRTIVGQAGARLKDRGCRPNLSVVFTSQPQAYLDALHARNVDALGYHGAIKVSHAIQAWYVTGIQDNRGQVFVDQDGFLDLNGSGSSNSAFFMSVGGWRFRPDLTSAILFVTIIVNSAETGHNTISEIADYVAMMGLSRTDDYDDCQIMPSITNLLSPNCDDKLKPDAITASDIAYLRGVYKMDAGATLKIQQDQIAAEMQKALGGK